MHWLLDHSTPRPISQPRHMRTQCSGQASTMWQMSSRHGYSDFQEMGLSFLWEPCWVGACSKRAEKKRWRRRCKNKIVLGLQIHSLTLVMLRCLEETNWKGSRTWSSIRIRKSQMKERRMCHLLWNLCRLMRKTISTYIVKQSKQVAIIECSQPEETTSISTPTTQQKEQLKQVMRCLNSKALFQLWKLLMIADSFLGRWCCTPKTPIYSYLTKKKKRRYSQ